MVRRVASQYLDQQVLQYPGNKREYMHIHSGCEVTSITLQIVRQLKGFATRMGTRFIYNKFIGDANHFLP